MAFNRHISNYVREHKPLFTAVLVGLFLLELEILIIATARSGPEPTLLITNTQGQIVYEATGRDLGTFDPTAFEKTFGPIESYQVRRVSRDIPFPFRAWFVAAAGIPLGGMLLLAFIIRAFVAVFQGDRRQLSANSDNSDINAQIHENRIERVLDKIGRLNIFAMGFFMFLIVISYWILPNAMVYLGRVGIDTIIRYRWFFLAGIIAVLGIFIWMVYLKYLLAKKQMESRAELEKYRLQLQLGYGQKPPLRLISSGPEDPPSLLTRNELKTDEHEQS